MDYSYFLDLLDRVRYCTIASLSQFPDTNTDSTTSSQYDEDDISEQHIRRGDSYTEKKNIILPYSTILFFHADKDGIYWTSARESQHSINFYLNEVAFITLFEENLLEGTGNEKGLYLQGTVDILSDPAEILKARTLSTEKANRDRCEKIEVQSPDTFMNSSVRAVYRFTPERAWTNVWEPDDLGRYCDSRRILNVRKLFPDCI